MEAEVILMGRMAVVTTRDGKRALIPQRILCDLARRFNLCYKGYQC